MNCREMQTKPERSPRKSLEAATKRREMYKIMHIEVETKSRKLLEAWANREKFPIELRANSEKIVIEAEAKPRKDPWTPRERREKFP